MPAILRPGMTVEGRKPLRNPTTITGFPQWNTYAPLGMKSAAKALNDGLRQGKARGGKSRVHSKRKLERGNLCHRLQKPSLRLDRIDNALRECKRLGFAIERENDERLLDELIQKYEEKLDVLKELRAHKQIEELLHCETSRGCELASRRI